MGSACGACVGCVRRLGRCFGSFFGFNFKAD